MRRGGADCSASSICCCAVKPSGCWRTAPSIARESSSWGDRARPRGELPVLEPRCRPDPLGGPLRTPRPALRRAPLTNVAGCGPPHPRLVGDGAAAPSAPAGAGSVVNRCGGGWSAVADAPSAPERGQDQDTASGAATNGRRPQSATPIYSPPTPPALAAASRRRSFAGRGTSPPFSPPGRGLTGELPSGRGDGRRGAGPGSASPRPSRGGRLARQSTDPPAYRSPLNSRPLTCSLPAARRISSPLENLV